MATCIRCGKPCGNGETMCDDCKIWFQQKTGKAAPIAKPKSEPKAEPKTESGQATTDQTQQTTPQKQTPPPVVNQSSAAGKAVDTKKLGTGLAAVVVVLLVVLVVGKVVSSRGNKVETGDVEVAQDNNSDDGDDGDDGDYYDTETESYDEEGDYVDEDGDYEEDEPEEEEAGEEESEFIFPNSDSEYLSEDDLEGLSDWELRIGRNEIMARHGRMFNDESLQEYFDSCSWYEGTLEPEEFDSQYDSILNKYEKQNANTIKAYENR